MKKVGVLYCLNIFFLLFATGCGEKVFDLDGVIKRINYSELPHQVQEYISQNEDVIVKARQDIYHTTDSSVVFTYGRSGASDSWFAEIHSNYHHFFIEGIHYRLKGNKGSPFILHEGVLYFCKLNFSLYIHKSNYRQQFYYKVKLSPSMR